MSFFIWMVEDTKNTFKWKFLQFMKWKNKIWGIYEVKCWENGNLLHIGSKSYDMKYTIVTVFPIVTISIVSPLFKSPGQSAGFIKDWDKVQYFQGRILDKM